jgi:hypothetical protein
MVVHKVTKNSCCPYNYYWPVVPYRMLLIIFPKMMNQLKVAAFLYNT